MLENAKLILTLTLPRFLMDIRFQGLEDFYSTWVNLWVLYGDSDWFTYANESVWDVCDDTPGSVSCCRYAQSILNEHQKQLIEHFNDMAKQISYMQLPHQITVKPLGMKGVVIWSIQ